MDWLREARRVLEVEMAVDVSIPFDGGGGGEGGEGGMGWIGADWDAGYCRGGEDSEFEGSERVRDWIEWDG